MKKEQEVAEAIIRNNQDLVLRCNAVINDGLKLDLDHDLSLEKVPLLIFRKVLDHTKSQGREKSLKNKLLEKVYYLTYVQSDLQDENFKPKERTTSIKEN